MRIRATSENDLMLLKRVRLAALLDTPTAFGVSYKTAADYDCDQWKQRASSTGTELWLAFEEGGPVGMVGAAVSESERFTLIGMWVEPAARGSGIAKELVDIVKDRSTERGFDGVFLDVSPENVRASSERDRKSVVEGKSVSVRVDRGDRRLIKKKRTGRIKQRTS